MLLDFWEPTPPEPTAIDEYKNSHPTPRNFKNIAGAVVNFLPFFVTLVPYSYLLTITTGEIDESVLVYRQCLDIFLSTLGDMNLKTACARQALGLALFIQVCAQLKNMIFG